jgi:hemolysin III
MPDLQLFKSSPCNYPQIKTQLFSFACYTYRLWVVMLTLCRQTMASNKQKLVWLKKDFSQTRTEELANSLIHAGGIILSFIGLLLLISAAAAQANIYKLVGGIIFATCSIFTYSFSVLYHSCRQQQLKKHFRLLDHISIYLLIAGSYTPFTLVTLHGTKGWVLLTLIWTLAVCGMVFKLIFSYSLEKLSLALYLAMGWLSLCVIKPLWALLPVAGFSWLLAGGICYSLGTFFYYRDRLYYHHAIWHVFVLAGTCCHFLSIFCYVIN